MNTPSKQTLKKYGLTLDEWLALYNKHDGRCWICGAYFDGRDRGKPRLACVDHEHVNNYKNLHPEDKRKYVRGILCYQCNRLVAQKSNTVDKLTKAIDYLNKYKNT